jgi:AhpD family alkylhydroperoxidase
MRLAILDKGHRLGTKVLFGVIRMASRQPVLDVIKLVKYRSDFYGAPMQKVTQEAMRGPSAWSVGDRELMAAVVSQANECEWCTKAHGAVARGVAQPAPPHPRPAPVPPPPWTGPNSAPLAALVANHGKTIPAPHDAVVHPSPPVPPAGR